jgi:hypothetical protein
MNAHDPNAAIGEPIADDDIGGHNVLQITLITKRDAPSLMSKRISLTNDGKLHSDGSECRMFNGTATRAFAERACADYRQLRF